MQMKILLTTVSLSALFVFCCGCSINSSTGPVDPDLEVVVGTITEIDDGVPRDGGVTIDLELEDRSSARLWLGLNPRSQPPREDQWELYRVILTLDVGDTVWAAGIWHGTSIELREIGRIE